MFNKILSFSLCIMFLFCTACSKNDVVSNSASVIETSSKSELISNTSSTHSKTDDTSSKDSTTSTSSNNSSSNSAASTVTITSSVSSSSTSSITSTPTHDVTSTPQENTEVIPNRPQQPPPIVEEEPKDPFTGKDFTFKSIKDVGYFCAKNLPQGNAVYIVTDVITDDNKEISIGCQIYSYDNSIKIDGKTITIPYEYKRKNKSVTLYAKHSITGIKSDFTITFGKEWELIFEDQFEGTELDTNVWEHRPEWLRDKGYVNYFSHEMTFLDGEGHLVSRAAPGKKKLWDYSNNCYKEVDAYLSGAVSTKDLFTSTYGYYEASVKLHHQTGMWGAFWLVCGDMDSSNPSNDGSSENGCEIDVFESLYNHGGVSQNLHWDGFTGHTGSAPGAPYVTQINTYDGEYHKFAISWTPNEYVFLVDGIVTRRINAKTAGGICNQPGYMLITTECGTWAGSWVLEEGEYSDMLVDYVRVYTSDQY